MKNPNPKKEKPYKDLPVWFQCFYKAKVTGGAAVPAGWGVLGAAGSWVRRGFLQQAVRGAGMWAGDSAANLGPFWGAVGMHQAGYCLCTLPMEFPLLATISCLLVQERCCWLLCRGELCGVSCAALWNSPGRVCMEAIAGYSLWIWAGRAEGRVELTHEHL